MLFLKVAMHALLVLDDPTEILLMQYFRGTPKEADKLKVITLVQKNE